MANKQRSHDEMISFLHWVCRTEVQTPNQTTPVVHEYGPYAFKEEAIRKAVKLRDSDYADYFETNDKALKQKWHDEGPPFLSLEVDPHPDLDDNTINITIVNIKASRPPVNVRRPSNGIDAPSDESGDEIDSDIEQHTGYESTPRPYHNWKQHEDGDHYRHLDGWMVAISLEGKDTFFGPYASELQATRMMRKLTPIVDKNATMEIMMEAHMDRQNILDDA